MVIRVALGLAALTLISPSIAGLLATGFIVFLWWSHYIQRRLQKSMDALRERYAAREHFESDVNTHLCLIQTNAAEKRVFQELRQRAADYAAMAVPVWRRLEHVIATKWLVLLLTRLAVIGMAVLLFRSGAFRAGVLLTCVFWAQAILGEMEWANRLSRDLADNLSAIDKFKDTTVISTAVRLSNQPIPWPHPVGKIEFQAVSFAYPPVEGPRDPCTSQFRPPTSSITNISFCVQPGERFAIVGPSGAGKSTIISLLLRCYDPTEGAVLIDDIDLRGIDLEQYRKAVGVVEQSVELMDQPIKYNLEFGCPAENRPDHGQLRSMLTKLRLISASEDLDHTILRSVGSNGIGMSGGERQRLGIGRALLKEPAIVILDEPSSHLDSTNEYNVIEIFTRLVGRTIIVVSHQPSIVTACDRVLVVDRGRVVGLGTHNELLASCELYAHLITKRPTHHAI
jgi:ABC-type multidrug transport system fused ATPase/permease subunit